MVNKSESVKDTKKTNVDDLTPKEKKEYKTKSKRKRRLIQEKLIKFATRVPAFMYLTDFRENTLQDVITKLEPRFRGFGQGSEWSWTRPETPGFASYLPSSEHLFVPPWPKKRKSRPNRPGLSIVAGTGFEPVTFGL